ncbi:MAG: DUF4240 domain-containing protein [Planctomycetota bacterium]
MTHEQFWEIIDEACRADPRKAEEWDERLAVLLAQLSSEAIIAWDQIFDELVAQAYRNDLWAAAYLINGGASDDGFYYFRCWLVGMGREVYESAVADPDSLTSVVSPQWHAEGIDAEAEIYSAAHRAWMQVTGKPDAAEYPVRSKRAELVGEGWDFDDDDLMSMHLPKLSSLYNA